METAHLRERYATFCSQCRDHMAHASAVLDDNRPAEATTLAMLRWQYVRLLTEFDAFKNREIFASALWEEVPEKAALARELQVACTEMGHAFRAYVLKWSTVDKSVHWDEYHAAANAIIKRLHGHFEREGPLIERLLADPPKPTDN